MADDESHPLQPAAQQGQGRGRDRRGRGRVRQGRGRGRQGRGRGTRPAPDPVSTMPIQDPTLTPTPALSPTPTPTTRPPGQIPIWSESMRTELATRAEEVRSRQRIMSRRVAARGLPASIRRGDTERPGRALAMDFQAAAHEGEGPINANPNHIVEDVQVDAPMATQPDTQPEVSLPQDHADTTYSEHDSEDHSDTPDTLPTTVPLCDEELTRVSPPPFADPPPPVTDPPRPFTSPPPPTTTPSPAPPTTAAAPPNAPNIAPCQERRPRQRGSRRDRPVLPSEPAPIDPENLLDEQIDDYMWMPGGPRFGTVLTSYPTHIARYIWDPLGYEWVRKTLRCYSQKLHFLQLHQYARTDPGSWWSIAERSGLTSLGTLRYGDIDHVLIAAFVERWYPETNSFHFPWGEITITLHDVAMILGLPIDGLEVAPQDDWPDSALRIKICEMFNITMDKMYAYSGHAGINATHIKEFIEAMIKNPDKTQEDIASAYLFLLLGCTIFCDRSTNKVKHKYMQLLLNHDKTDKFAWGAGVLALLYRNLGEASRAHAAGIAGCVRLLQCWIWRYFPRFGGPPSLNPERLRDPRAAARDEPGPIGNQTHDRLIEIRRLLDGISVEEVQWMPWREGDGLLEINFRTTHRLSRLDGILRCMDVQEPYYATRVLRQFGLRQVPPLQPYAPSSENRIENISDYKVEFNGDEYPTWEERESHLFDIDAYQRCRWSWECDEHYMDYFLDITHPYVDPTSQPQQVPRPPAVDATVRLQLSLGSVRERLQCPRISNEETEYLISLIGFMTGEPYPVPDPPQRASLFQNSEHVRGEGSGSGREEEDRSDPH